MRKAEIADWVLSQFIDPRHASAVVGDLAEQSTLSWISVGRIAARSVVADWRDRPGALVFLAIQAFILQLGLAVLRSRLFPTQPAMDFLVGPLPVLWLVHRAPGREAAAYLALILVNVLVAASVAALSSNTKVEFHPAIALYLIALFGFVVVERRRRLHYAQS